MGRVFRWIPLFKNNIDDDVVESKTFSIADANISEREIVQIKDTAAAANTETFLLLVLLLLLLIL
jgi:hypothetical protein